MSANSFFIFQNIVYSFRISAVNNVTIYLFFNGITKKNNPLINHNKKTIDNLRRVNLEIVLVPLFDDVKSLSEGGKIVRFAIENRDIIKGINFQIGSFNEKSMRIKDRDGSRKRINYNNIIEVIDKEFKGQIVQSDFYPISFIYPIAKMIELVRQETQVEYAAHPGCGGSTFLFFEDEKPIPITRFIDVEAFLEFLLKQSQKKGPLRKIRVAASFFKNIEKFFDYEKTPRGFDFKQYIKDAALGGSNYALREIRPNSMFVGFMGFQDVFNLNIDRLQRCVIHYTTPEGIIPSCLYIGLGYGRRIRRKYSISINEWEEKTGHKLKDDLFYSA